MSLQKVWLESEQVTEVDAERGWGGEWWWTRKRSMQWIEQAGFRWLIIQFVGGCVSSNTRGFLLERTIRLVCRIIHSYFIFYWSVLLLLSSIKAVVSCAFLIDF